MTQADRDGRDNPHETKRPIILAKPPVADKAKELEIKRDEEFPTLQQAHHRDGTTKSPTQNSAATETSRASEDRLLEVGKILLGRHDSVGKSQSNNSGASNAAASSYATPPKAVSPRPSTDDTSHVLPQRVSDLLNMEAPPFKERVSQYHVLLSF